jgi:hypothetical protein
MSTTITLTATTRSILRGNTILLVLVSSKSRRISARVEK